MRPGATPHARGRPGTRTFDVQADGRPVARRVQRADGCQVLRAATRLRARCCQVLPGAAGPVLPGAAGYDRAAGPFAPAGVAAASGDMLGLVHKLIHIQDMLFDIVAEEQRIRALQTTGCGGQVSSLPGPLSLTSVPVLSLNMKQRGALISVTAVTRPGGAEPERTRRAAPSRRTRRRRPQEQRPPWSGARSPAWSGARTRAR